MRHPGIGIQRSNSDRGQRISNGSAPGAFVRPARLEFAAGVWLLAAIAAAGCRGESRDAVKATASAASAASNDKNALQAAPFVDRTQELGIDFTYSDGSAAELSTMLESLGGGVGWLDFDRDGWLDLVATGGGSFPSNDTIAGRAGALFRNVDGKQFVSVGEAAGVEADSLFTHGVAIADYDDDGFQDFLVTGYGQPQFWRNMGDGTFREESAATGLLDDRWGSSAAWSDLNGDGNLDLYLCHYVDWSFENHPYCASNMPNKRDNCPPREFQPLPDVVFYSQGDGTFVDASSSARLRDDGKGLGVLICDVEPDGDMDIYVANDTTDNFLYINDGHGVFEEVAVAAGVARDDRGIPNGSMGVDVCDFNRDGRPDLWVANYERETFALYRNEGHGRFLHVSQRLGITDLSGLFVGFGTACADFDSDGDEDLMVSNGHVVRFPVNSPRKQLPLLMQYDGRRFQRVRSAPGSYFGDPHEGRGLAVADFDADGDLDAAISHQSEPLALLENQFHKHNHALELSLIGARSNRDAVGARVELTSGEQVWRRQIVGGGSYLSHNGRSLFFALPEQPEPRSLVVHWPSGVKQTLDASSLSGQVTLLEPAADDGSPPRLRIWKEFE